MRGGNAPHFFFFYAPEAVPSIKYSVSDRTGSDVKVFDPRVPQTRPLAGMCDDPPWIQGIGFRPCRKCDACRRYDQWQWTQRALLERLRAPTIFATFTLRPRGDKWVPSDKETWPDMRDMFKRLRADGYNFRYLCAPEFGDKRGRHHYHVLFHSSDLNTRSARGQWKQGFTHARRATEFDCAYVAEYATKQSGRKRASNFYGRGPDNDLCGVMQNDTVQSVLAAFPQARISGVGSVRVPRAVFKGCLDKGEVGADIRRIRDASQRRIRHVPRRGTE